MSRLHHHPFFIRLLHWEYWNSKIVYAPLYPYWLWLSIRARSFFFLTAANPAIKNGGFIMESKKDVYDLLPQPLYPRTLHFAQGVEAEKVFARIDSENLNFPVIAKPDFGERGLGVKKIYDAPTLRDYIARIPVDFLVQEFATQQYEVGIFYYRYPGQAKGNISGIVSKEPVVITGNGQYTVRQLIHQNDRYRLQWHWLQKTFFAQLDNIPAINEKIILSPYGNHARGSKFTDESFKMSEQLVTTIDRICKEIPGFYFGRLDIMYNDWQSLEQGIDISIIEVNGSGSEPTHIYDPKHSIFFAWKEIIRHWNILFRISKKNHGAGVPYLSFDTGRKEIKAFKQIDQKLSAEVW